MPDLPDPGVLAQLLSFAVVLGTLVFVHEWGHYIVARLFGTRIDSFSIGFGPELFGWTDRRGTRWRLSALPLGGYVKFAGDANVGSKPDPSVAPRDPAERAKLFHFKPVWQRAAIVAAGPSINFLFAILIFALLFMTVGQQFTTPKVEAVLPKSPAATAGVRPGDTIVRIGGRTIDRFEQVRDVVVINAGEPLALVVRRGGASIPLTIVPERVTETDRFGNIYETGRIGLVATGQSVVRRDLFSALVQATGQTVSLTRSMAETLWQIISGRRAVSELGGPLKIAQYSGQSAALGPLALVTFIALVSINLGFVNFLPIPMLDGGHLFLYAIEAVRGRPVNPVVLEWSFRAGLALVLSLMLFLTVNDLASFGVWSSLARVFS